MASAFARSSRSKDEDDLRKDHKKRGFFNPPRKLSDIGKNVTEEIREDEARRAPKKKKEDINLPDPLKGKPIAQSIGNKHVYPHVVKGGDEDDPRWADFYGEGGRGIKEVAERSREYTRKYLRPLKKDKKK